MRILRWNAACRRKVMEGTSPQGPPDRQPPQDFTEFMSSLGRSARRFLRLERDHLELLLSDRAARAGTGLIGGVLGLFLFCIALLLAVMAGAKVWGEHLGSEARGYLAMSGVVAGFLVVMWLLWKPIARWLKVRILNVLHGHD
jgi:hypothetical protein